jgi:cell wall-associated NlpC family hydrolase
MFVAALGVLLLASPAAPADTATVEAVPGPTASPVSSPADPTSAQGGDAAVPKPALTAAQLRQRRIKAKREKVVRIARQQLGIPYLWGGASRRGFDCSGFTMYTYKRVGSNLPHGATLQSRRGKAVSLKKLRKGDLVFFGTRSYYGHVAMYVGNGRIIHAPRRGTVVSINKLTGAAAARRLID